MQWRSVGRATTLAAVAPRWPSLRLATDEPLRWHQRGPFRGLDALVVRP
jgi:hypothetical protein